MIIMIHEWMIIHDTGVSVLLMVRMTSNAYYKFECLLLLLFKTKPSMIHFKSQVWCVHAPKSSRDISRQSAGDWVWELGLDKHL